MKLAMIVSIVLSVLASGCHHSFRVSDEVLDLSGTWKFRLDPDNAGMTDKWFNTELYDSVHLPGTTDENLKGILKDERAEDRLSRVWYWKGAAWYQKEVDIPEHWEGKKVTLLLERTKDTYVWFDDQNCGYENTLSAPQYFDLSKAIKPGKHRITVLVDNAKLPPVGPSHAVDERTQTNWNGIVGRIELQATDHVWIEEVQTYPDVKNNRVKIRVIVGNSTGEMADGELDIIAESWNTADPSRFRMQKEKFSGIGGNKSIEFSYDFGKKAPLWDEFDPALIKLSLNLSTRAGGNSFRSSKQMDFGMREIRREGKYIILNGKRIFLRGRTDSANYPLTGYPPMDKEAWLKYFKLLKSYGINHWRFHSWCPPNEAFMAADEVGVYLQPELPNKRSGMDSKSMDDEAAMKMYNIDYLAVDTGRINLSLKDYLKREGELIFKHLGNHPSFVLFTLGNELDRNEAMYNLVAHFKTIDPRRIYAQGSNNRHWEPGLAAGDDFWVTARTALDMPVRGAFFVGDLATPHIEHQSPSTLVDYSKSIIDVPVPVIEPGGVVNIGEIAFDFKGIDRAQKLKILISIEGTKYRNEYDLWVYPDSIDTRIPDGIMVSTGLDSKTRKHLQDGGRAIIFPDHEKLTNCINGAFQTDFWCYPMFARAAINLGIEPAPVSRSPAVISPDSTGTSIPEGTIMMNPLE